MPWNRTKAMREERGEQQKEMRTILDQADAEKRDLSQEETGKFDELSKRSDELTEQISRYEQAEADEKRNENQPQPGRDDADGRDPEQRHQNQNTETRETKRREALGMFLRSGSENLTAEQRSLLSPDADAPQELRATTISGVGGFGVVGTRRTYDQLVKAMKGYTGVREAGAMVLSTANGNPMTIPTADDTSNTGELLTEGSQTNSDDPTVDNADLTAYTYSAKELAISFQLAEDSEFDIEAHVMQMAAERIARKVNEHTTNGTGSSQPNGLVTAATANRHEATANDGLDYDDLLDLMDTVDYAYHKGPSAGFMMHQKTLTEARKLTDNDDRPIWSPAMGDRDESIHGYRVTLNNDLAQFGGAQNNVVAAFGAWNKYFLRDMTRPYIIRDPYTNAKKGLITFYVFSRHGGQLSDTSAIGLLDLPAAA